MKNFLLCLLFFFTVHFSKGQYWMQFGGGLTIDEGMDVTTDGGNNFYATGYFTTTSDFYLQTPLVSSGLDDIFILKTNPGGVIQWSKKAGGSNADRALSIDADNSGNVVITGYYFATAQFDAQAITSAGQQDMFVAKYNSAGTLLWVNSAGGSASDIGNSVTFDNSGNVIVTGEFSGTSTFGSIVLTSAAGSIDVFTVKYDAGGNVLWAKKGSGIYTDRGTDVDADAAGNIYVSGMFSDTISFDVTHNNGMFNAMFLIQYDASGNEQWFRWMGSGATVGMGGMDVRGSAINMAGKFSGTLYFFGGAGTPTLAGPHANNIFVCRYDTAGNLIWTHADGSSSEVSAEAIASRPNGEVVVAGNFKCRFIDFSAHYGDGIFCSMGYNDCYVASYDNSGNWLWARHYGGRREDAVNGICSGTSLVSTIGSYRDKMLSTAGTAGFLGHNTSQFTDNSAYCSDPDYGHYVFKIASGNSDVYINSNFDLSRQPLDYFYRNASTCDRSFTGICIDSVQNMNQNQPCVDTIRSCSGINLYVRTNTYYNRQPNWINHWDNTSSAGFYYIGASGHHWISVTSEDGCFSDTDSVYVEIHSPPSNPQITDSKGFNTSTSFPATIKFCYPDSVELLCTNVGSNAVSWLGFPSGLNPVTVDTTMQLTCFLTNSFGCSSLTNVDIEVSNPLINIAAGIVCLNDTDLNDTISLCLGDVFLMYAFDSITTAHPLDTQYCIPDLGEINWTISDSINFTHFLTTNCTSGPPFAVNSVTTLTTGDYDLFFTAWVYQANACDTDSVFLTRSIHVSVHPMPVPFTISVTTSGPTQVCPGDSILLVASGGTTYQWTDFSSIISTDDSVYISNAGNYGVSCDSTIVNAFGCSTDISGFASVQITSYNQPNVSMSPANGLVCPGDSIRLLCSDTGSYNWQGPSGSIGINDSVIYVTTPGFYYCILSPVTGCDLLSNTIVVSSYNTPVLSAFPSTNLCNTDSVSINVISNPSSIIQWLPPLSGSDTLKIIYSPGTYLCNVTSCGITTLLSMTILLDTGFAVIFPDDSVFCSGDSVQLGALPGLSHYLWLPGGDTTQNTFAHSGGSQSLIVTSPNGCIDTASIVLNELANNLFPPVTTDTILCMGYPLQLTAAGNDTIFWSHSLSYSDTFNTGNLYNIANLNASAVYYLFTQSGLCRSAFDSVTVTADESCHDILIPNVMTPNNDAFNNFFPDSSGHYLIDLKVFNRWGNVVFETQRSAMGWNGKDSGGEKLPESTYYYILKVTFPDNFAKQFNGVLYVTD